VLISTDLGADQKTNNYLFDKKKVKLFFTDFFRVLKTAVLSRVRVGGGGTIDKTDVFSTRTKKKVEKRISFFYWT
jgi:hypothetical protein